MFLCSWAAQLMSQTRSVLTVMFCREKNQTLLGIPRIDTVRSQAEEKTLKILFDLFTNLHILLILMRCERK